MKVLKSKIVDELKRLEYHEMSSGKSLNRSTLDDAYKLAKTLYYLDKTEALIEAGKLEK